LKRLRPANACDPLVGERRSSARARASAAGVLALLLLPLVVPVLVGVRTIGDGAALDNDALYRREESPPRRPVTTDLSAIAVDLGRDRALATGFRSAQLATWSPLAGAGMPLWAEQGNPFFPLKLPFYLWPSWRMYDLTLLGRLLVAGLGAYVLARVRGLGHPAALIAGATYELSGTLLANLPFATAGAPSLLPWAVALAYRLAARRDRRAVGATALVLGMAVLAGHPTLGLVVFMAFATTLAGLVPRGMQIARTGVAAGLAVTLALLIAAAPGLPFLDLLQVGELYKDTPMGPMTNAIQLHVARNTWPLALFVPGVLVGPSIVDPHAIAAAVGPLVLALAVAGVCVGGLDLPLVLLGMLGIVIATAPVPTGLIPLVRFVVPPYAWPLVTLVATQAAGVGATTGMKNRRAVLAALVALALGPASLALVRNPGTPYAAQYATLLHGALADPRHVLVLLAPLGCALLVVTMVGLLGRPRRAAVRASLLLAMAAATQLVVLGPFLLREPSRMLDGPVSPAVRFLHDRLADGQSRLTGFGPVGFPMTASLLFGLRDLRCVAGLPVRRYVKFLAAGGASTALNRRTADQSLPLESPLLDLAATRWVAHERNTVGAATLPLPVAHQDAYVAIHERRSALPRARVVHRVERVADEDAAYARLATLREKPVDPFVAIVEPDEHGVFPEALADGPQLEPVSILEEGAHHVVLQTTLAGAGLVVLADTYYPGWTARVDQQPAAIYPTNLLFRGVRVPAGRHRIEFRYVPADLWPGVVLGALASIVSLAMVFWPARR
jgi:hypothetical protein